MSEILDWDVAVYCMNEAASLQACLDSIKAALAGSHARITAIVNGSTDGSLEIARQVARAGAAVEWGDAGIYRSA